MTRERLPNRRDSELIDFSHDRVAYCGSVSRYGDGRLGEVFLDCRKVNTQAGNVARDCAIAASLAFQHGCSVKELREALTRTESGGGAGPLAKLLDLVEGASRG